MKNVPRYCAYYFISLFLFSFHYVPLFSFSFSRIGDIFQKLPASSLRFFGELRARRPIDLLKSASKIIGSGMIFNSVYVAIRCKFNFNNDFFRELEQRMYNAPIVGRVLEAKSMQGNKMIYQYDDPDRHLNGYGKCVMKACCFVNFFAHIFPKKDAAYDKRKIDRTTIEYGDALRILSNAGGKESSNYKDTEAFFYSFVKSFFIVNEKNQEIDKNGIQLTGSFFLNDLLDKKSLTEIQSISSLEDINGRTETIRSAIRRVLECCIATFIENRYKISNIIIQTGTTGDFDKKGQFSEKLSAKIREKFLKDLFVRTMASQLSSKITDDCRDFLTQCFPKENSKVPVTTFFEFLKNALFVEKKPFAITVEEKKGELGSELKKKIPPLGGNWQAVVDKFLEELGELKKKD